MSPYFVTLGSISGISCGSVYGVGCERGEDVWGWREGLGDMCAVLTSVVCAGFDHLVGQLCMWSIALVGSFGVSEL